MNHLSDSESFTCGVHDGDGRALHALELCVDADLVLRVRRQVEETLPGGSTTYTVLLSVAICKWKVTWGEGRRLTLRSVAHLTQHSEFSYILIGTKPNPLSKISWSRWLNPAGWHILSKTIKHNSPQACALTLLYYKSKTSPAQLRSLLCHPLTSILRYEKHCE